MTRLLWAVVAVVWLWSGLHAQDSRGQITGRILDPSGAAVPKAQIKMTHRGTNTVATGASNEQGIYEVRFLQPGRYTFQATLAGFKSYSRDDIEVRVADRLNLDIALEVGNVAESMNVTAEAPMLEASTASLGIVVDQRRIEDMPIHGGNTFSLARLAAGVNSFVAANLPTELSASNVVSWFGVDGTPQQNTEFSIDGTPSMSGRAPSYTPPPDMVAEFKIQTANYDASIGRTPGGAINVALKSGSNELHGTLYEFHNDAHLQSMDLFQRQFLNNPATGPVTDEKRKQAYPYNVFNRFGGTVGGPWYIPKVYDGRNRSFWIFGYEGYRRDRNEPGSSILTVPTIRERRGDFSELLAVGSIYQIYDPATTTPAAGGRFSRQPLAGNIIPASRLDKTAQNFIAYWPEPNNPATADGLNNFYRPRRSRDKFGSYNGRVDHNLSDRQRIFGRYYKTSQVWSGGNQVLGNIATGNQLLRDSQGGGLDTVYTINPATLLNVRYSFARYIQWNQPYSQGMDLVALGLPAPLVQQLDAAAVMFPQVNADSYQQLGNANSNRALTNYHVMAADVTRMQGAHSIRAGFEYRIYREHNFLWTGGSPQYDFGAAWTRGPLDTSPAAPIGQGLASMLFGYPTGGGLTINASGAEQSVSSALYIQDDWKITRKLTLNMGMRWDYDSPITERFNRSVRGYDFVTPSPIEAQARVNYARGPIPEIPAAQFRVTGGLTFAGVNGQPRELWQGDRNNFSPRIGLAYSLNNKTVLRGGYGIFYVPLGADRSSVNQTGFSTRNTLVASTDNGQSFVATTGNPFPSGLRPPVGAGGGLMTNAGQAVSFFNERPRNGYMQRWSASVQRQMPSRFVWEVTYVGNRGTKLEVSNPLNSLPVQYLSRTAERDQATINYLAAQFPNPFYPLLAGTGLAGTNVGRSQLLTPYPHFTGLSAAMPLGYSWYHSLQSTLERRLSGGVSLQANYTWAKYMDAGSFLNPGEPKLEELIAAEDRQHRFTATGIWELPFGRGRRLLGSARGAVDQLVNGWSLQAVWQANTGAPLGFGNALFIGDVRDIALAKSERTLSRWFNTSGFVRDASRQVASNYRTFSNRLSGVRGPGMNLWDISLIKRVRISERVKLQIRGEFLNATNRTHFGAPATGPTSTLFGQITASSGYPRQLHLGLRLEF